VCVRVCVWLCVYDNNVSHAPVHAFVNANFRSHPESALGLSHMWECVVCANDTKVFLSMHIQSMCVCVYVCGCVCLCVCPSFTKIYTQLLKIVTLQ